MDILQPEPASKVSCAIDAGLEQIITGLGTSHFEASVFRAMQAATGSAHMSAFVFPVGGAPRTLLAMTRDSQQAASRCAERYTAAYWPMDPTVDLHGSNALNSGITLVRSRPADIEHAAYRSECYSTVHLVERIGALARVGSDLVRIHAYRSRSDGPFGEVAITGLARHARILAALLMRHDQMRPAPRRVLADRLRDLTPPMPMRERQVCEGIATGMSSEAIGLELGVSLNTVLSYRKRAYARLGITSQTELMHLLFGLRH